MPANRKVRLKNKWLRDLRRGFLFSLTLFIVVAGIFALGVRYGRSLGSSKNSPHESLVEHMEMKSLLPTIEYTFTERLTRPEPISNRDAVTQKEPSSIKIQTSFSIQVAAFRKSDQAEDLIRELKSHGYKAYLGPTQFTSDGPWYRVWVGPFLRKNMAQKTIRYLNEASYSSSFLVSHQKNSEGQDGL